MSAVIKTLTPFIEQDILLKALTSLDVEWHVKNGLIITNRVDYQGHQQFQFINGKYHLIHDSDELGGDIYSRLHSNRYLPIKEFLSKLEGAYKSAYDIKLKRIAEAERIKMEAAKKEYVAATKAKAIAQAKAKGYSVKESKVNGKIKLVLTRMGH